MNDVAYDKAEVNSKAGASSRTPKRLRRPGEAFGVRRLAAAFGPLDGRFVGTANQIFGDHQHSILTSLR